MTKLESGRKTPLTVGRVKLEKNLDYELRHTEVARDLRVVGQGNRRTEGSFVHNLSRLSTEKVPEDSSLALVHLLESQLQLLTDESHHFVQGN